MILLDYLQTRPDVDPARIGITGVSLGGMHSWLAAALDERIAVAAPMIGVQVRMPAAIRLLGTACYASRSLLSTCAAADVKQSTLGPHARGRVQIICAAAWGHNCWCALQCFGWAVENDAWHARVASIPKVFAAAAADMGRSEVEAEVVKAVWDRLLPGLLEVRRRLCCPCMR